jgi:hypothetical protein
MTDVLCSVRFDAHALDQFRAAVEQAARAMRGFYEALVEWALRFARALAVLGGGVLKVMGWVRRHDVAFVAVSSGWRGLALRHAFRPPTRGYWARRCICQACGLRAFTRRG